MQWAGVLFGQQPSDVVGEMKASWALGLGADGSCSCFRRARARMRKILWRAESEVRGGKLVGGPRD